MWNKIGKDWDDDEDYTALEVARVRRETEVVSLLERFLANPAQTRHDLWVKLEVQDEVAAEFYAVMVFLCDGLLQLKPASNPPNPAQTHLLSQSE